MYYTYILNIYITLNKYILHNYIIHILTIHIHTLYVLKKCKLTLLQQYSYPSLDDLSLAQTEGEWLLGGGVEHFVSCL